MTFSLVKLFFEVTPFQSNSNGGRRSCTQDNRMRKRVESFDDCQWKGLVSAIYEI